MDGLAALAVMGLMATSRRATATALPDNSVHSLDQVLGLFRRQPRVMRGSLFSLDDALPQNSSHFLVASFSFGL